MNVIYANQNNRNLKGILNLNFPIVPKERILFTNYRYEQCFYD